MREHHECDRSEGVENKNQNIQLLNKFTMFEHVMQVAKMAIRHRTHTSYTRATTAYGQSNGIELCAVCVVMCLRQVCSAPEARWAALMGPNRHSMDELPRNSSPRQAIAAQFVYARIPECNAMGDASTKSPSTMYMRKKEAKTKSLTTTKKIISPFSH